MKITDGRNGTTNLNVNNDELGFIQALFNSRDVKEGFTAGLLNHNDVDLMVEQLTDWQEYKRLRAKFSGPAFEAQAARVKAVLCKS